METSFYNGLERYRAQTAVVDDTGVTLTYEDLENYAKKIGELLPQRSLAFCYCENTAGSLCSYIGCLYNSVVVLLLNRSIDKELNQELMNRYKPSFIFAPVEDRDIYSDYSDMYTEHGYMLLERGNKTSICLHDELALLLTTSGSTGSPKLVKQSFSNIQSNAQAIAEYLELDGEERPITTLPMNYTYGLSIINSHLQVGATICMTTKGILQKEFWDFFRQQQATSFGGVPYTYEMLKKLRFFGMKLPSLRTMTQAGGKLTPKLHKEFAQYAKEQGKRFVVMYGQTEATARMAYLPYEKSLDKYGSMGIAIPGGKFELIDVDGKIITASDTVGELVYYGPNVTLGYAEGLEDLKIGDERKGKLITGDMAKRDEDGYYYIVGRKKRFLKIFGNRVNLDECERMLHTEFVQNECACGGVDDKLCIYYTGSSMRGQSSISHDFDTEKGEEIGKKMEQFLSHKTGLHPSAFVSMQVEEIPKNDAGKILYKELPAIG